MSENEIGFIPNTKKKRFTISIEVFENCQRMSIYHEEDVKVLFQEVIGAIEVQRQIMILDQSLENMKEWIKIREQVS